MSKTSNVASLFRKEVVKREAGVDGEVWLGTPQHVAGGNAGASMEAAANAELAALRNMRGDFNFNDECE